MQHLYTRYSETHSSLRNVFARLRQSVLANSLRTVILIFVLALSCGAWGAEVVTSSATTWEYNDTHSAKTYVSKGDNGLYFNSNANTYIRLQNTNILHFNIPSGVYGTLTVTCTPQSGDYVALDMYIGNNLTETQITYAKKETTLTFNVPLTTSQASIFLKSIRSSSNNPNNLNSGGKQINVSKLVWSPASSCTTFTYHFGTEGQSDWQQECFVYEEGTTDTYYIKNYTIPNKPDYFVGWQGDWNDGTNTDWKSANVGLSTMPFALQRSKTLGQIENGNNVGAVGTLRIYGNSKDDNKYIGFIPGGYVLRLGNGDTWTSSALTAITNNIDETVWTTGTTTLTESIINGHYYVALKTADGFVWSPNRSTDSQVLGIMGQKNGADSWGNNLNTSDVGKRGFFRIWADNDANNFCCHFVPVYRIVYKANYPTGTAPADTYSADVSVEETKTITLAGTPAAPNGYVFSGWTLAQDGSGNVLASDAEYTLTQPQNDVVLYAQWTARETPETYTITYYDTDKTTKLTGLTPTEYTKGVGVAAFPTPVKEGYTFKEWHIFWTDGGIEHDEVKSSILPTDFGNVNLYAVWDTFCGEMMRATITGASSATLTGAGSADVKVAKGNATDGYKLGQAGHYVKLTLKNATFQAGDYVVVNVITPSAYLELYADKGNTQWCRKTGITTGKNILPIPAEAIGKNTVYLYRTSESAANMNPHITYMSIVRPCCTAPAFAWGNEPTNSRVQDEDFELSTTSNSGGAVIYQSNNTNVATIVDGNKLHFVGEGTVTITAVLAANGDYCDATLSTTIDVVDQCGTSSVIYNLPAGTEAKTLTTAESVTATEGLTANNAITAAGITLGTSGKELTEGDGNKENLTVSIPNTFQLDKTKYLSFEYTIADGKCFMPCDIQLKVQPISNACYFLIEMTDGNNTLSETTTSLEHSVVNDIRVNNPDNISFCGKVTLKIYSYGATTGYRLGTPIRILGTLDNSVTATIVPDGGTIPNAAALGWILQSDGTYTKQIPQGANLTMPDITRDGYTLTAYHDRNSDTYHPGNTFPLNANYTFTAQWRAVAPDGSVTAIVNPNGGVLTDETGWTKQLDGTFIQTVKKGSTLTLPEVTKTDYRFLYYTDETNDDYYPTSPFPLNADYVFTAQWCQHDTKLEWNVESWKFDDNGTAPKLTTTNLPDGALIQYVSSNTAVATISDDGSTITPFMGGQTTITAIYDGDGDYCPTEASYTLTVECNDPTPQIVGEGILTGCNTSITLRVKQAQETGLTDYPTTGYSFQWYKDGQPIANATADTYTAQTVGEYFVVVHRDCYSQSNTAKITSNAAATPEVVTLTRFQYYRPGHTYTDNADTRHLFAYKSAGEDSKACEIKTVIKHAAKTAEKPDAEITDMSFLQTTGTPDENGRYTVTASLNAISADIDNLLTAGDTIVVTLTPYDNCGTLATAYAQSLNIYITNKPALAFIISGADSYTRDNKKHKLHGDFLTGINKADLCKQSGSKWAEIDKGTELPLYRELKTDFEVVPVNGYAAFNLLNYEPFDIVMLTDFPKTDAIDKKTHPAYGVLDSLAYIVDYRPMFSLKGHMAKKELTTWGTKGFIADPETPTTNPQMNMTVLCYAHGIFDGLEDLKYTGESTPTKNDSLNKIILDKDGNIVVRITDGGGYNKEKALQGFTAVDANNFINIATIPGAKGGGSLITCCERQTNINARFLLLSVNADATSKITPIGQKAIIQGLHYLLETNAAKVSDCSVTFHNGGDTQNPGNGDHLWTTSTNWSTGRLPLKEQNIRIIANCIVNTTDASVANILIKDGNTLTINSNAALKTTGKIKQLNTDNTTSPLTNTNVITIKADASHTGALIHTTAEDETLAATVQLYSKAYLVVTADGKKEKYWQYIGIPIKEAPIPENFFGAYTYIYSEQKSGRGWTRQFDGSSLHGDFSGYATSQTQAETFVLKGDLAATTDRRIRLTYTADGGQGSNLIGNSWTAPIRIDQLQTSDFNGADATIYIYNTGRDDVKDNPSYIEGSTTATAGQWMSIPINMVNTAEWKGLKVIPAMQAFQVNTGEETDLVLNYNRLVRSSTTADINTPLRAPKRTDDALSVMRVRVSDSRTYTDLYLAQHQFFTDNFDNGWDAAFVEGDGRSASLYAITPLGEMAVAAQPQTDGTVLGFTPGRETEYTFSFGYTGEMLYLNDTKQKRSTLITDWNTYTFTANEDDDVNRFYISSTPIDVQTPTGLTNITTMDGILRINNPAHENLSIGIYDAAGRLCALSHTAEAMADIILPATQGVYLVHINGENTQIVHKVTR